MKRHVYLASVLALLTAACGATGTTGGNTASSSPTAALGANTTPSAVSAISTPTVAATPTVAVIPTTASTPIAAATQQTPGAKATSHVVQETNDFSFSPKTITINVGDTVVWKNAADIPHTSTADNGAWDSGNMDPGASFSHTFTKAGTYAYHCDYHKADGMVGTVIVKQGQGASQATVTTGGTTNIGTAQPSPSVQTSTSPAGNGGNYGGYNYPTNTSSATATSATSPTSTAPAGTGTKGTAPTQSRIVKVELSEWKITMPKTLPAGPTTFKVTNTGKVIHNFEIKDGIDKVFATNLDPGETMTMKVNLKPGKYEVWCPVGSHKELGMDLQLTVK